MNTEVLDAIRARTIKAVSDETWEKVNAGARRDNLTVGQWLEKRVDEWEQAGSPQTLQTNIPQLAALITAAGAMAQHTKLPPEVRSLINQCARQARGLPPRAKPANPFNGALSIAAPADDEAPAEAPDETQDEA